MNQDEKNQEEVLLRKINQNQAQQVKHQAEKVEQLDQTVEQQAKKVMQQKQEFFETEAASR